MTTLTLFHPRHRAAREREKIAAEIAALIAENRLAEALQLAQQNGMDYLEKVIREKMQ